MNYWVYKCNSKGEALGNNNWGDWEDEDAFGRGRSVFQWGNVANIPDLARPKKGDCIIAHQSDRHKLVGVAQVVGLRNGQFRLRPLERIDADMRRLKKEHATVARIRAYQPGLYRTIYDISNTDAELLLRLARGSAATQARGGGRARQRLADALDEYAASEEGLSFTRGTKGKGQGFGLPARERRVVERRAVDLAIAHFESDGWVVADVGNNQPYDLRCQRRGVELHVEVKGTIGLGQKVILPKNEVLHAQSYKHVALVVVHGVSLRRGKAPRATGGKLLLRHPWILTNRHLEPLAYYYEVGKT